MSKVKIDYYETRCDCCNEVIGKAPNSYESPSYVALIGDKRFVVRFHAEGDQGCYEEGPQALDICRKCRAKAVIDVES